MKKFIVLLILALPVPRAYDDYRPNCEAYRYMGDDCYNACKQSYNAIMYPQGSRKSQEYFDKAIDLCPDFAYAWHEKAVPYLKRGSFIEWKAMMDKAVDLEEEQRLGYRGWCRYQFLRDYEGAIKDIERLEEIMQGYDIGYAQNGDCHLLVAKALCYKGLGQKEKALQVLEAFVNDPNFFAMPYDFLHLAVMYLEADMLSKSEQALAEQIKVNPNLADNYYYLARTKLALGQKNASKTAFQKCNELYEQGLYRKDAYTTPMDAISKADLAKMKTLLGLS